MRKPAFRDQRSAFSRIFGKFFPIRYTLYAIRLKSQRGFALLLSVLVSSILIALGSAIFDVVSKEVILSSAGRESQFSFYAADTGIECVLYWDLKQNAFSTTSPQTDITCGGGPAVPLTRTLTNPGTLTEVLTTTFSFPVIGAAATNACADVTVTRLTSPTRTSVRSSGYNTCDTTNTLRIERAIRVTY